MHKTGDAKRPQAASLTPIEAVLEVVKSDCPNEWSRYCHLAHQLERETERTEISQEQAGLRHLAADGESSHESAARMGRMASFTSQLAGGPAMKLAGFEIILEETRFLELLFRERLASALLTHRYSLSGFDRLSPTNISPLLIKPEQFRFGSDEMEVGGGIKLTGVRIIPNQIVSVDGPGRKPGPTSAKRLACRAVLAILDDVSQRPPRGHGRMTKLARMVGTIEGKTYEVNSIEKFIRASVRDWETKNPDE